MANKEYLVKQKCYFKGAIRQVGEVVYIPEDEKVNLEVFCLRKDYRLPEPEPEFVPKSNGGIMAKTKTAKSKRKQLEEQADIFGIKYTTNTPTEELESLVQGYQAQ